MTLTLDLVLQVIQFEYGGDGLDPMMMEGKGKPVDFGRILALITHTHPHRQGHFILELKEFKAEKGSIQRLTQKAICVRGRHADCRYPGMLNYKIFLYNFGHSYD